MNLNLADLDTCVRGRRGDMVDFISELVAIASENPPGYAYGESVRAIQSRLRALDLPCDTSSPAQWRRCVPRP